MMLEIIEDLEIALGFDKEELTNIGSAPEEFEDYVNFNLINIGRR